ncbi:peptidase M48, Ste24p [Salinisphaera shabanensis T35B1]
MHGCTLHLPLLTLAHVDEAECTALIAHELSHVANADIEQAQALGAEQRAIAHSYDALQHTAARAQLNGLLTQPVFCITESVMAALDRAVARDRRTAEYRADRAAADASSASIAAATILRAAASQDVAQQAVVAGQNRTGTATALSAYHARRRTVPSAFAARGAEVWPVTHRSRPPYARTLRRTFHRGDSGPGLGRRTRYARR